MSVTTDDEEYKKMKAIWMRESPTKDGTENKARHLRSTFGISEDASYLLDR